MSDLIERLKTYHGHTGAYAPDATCKHGMHPYDCRDGCAPVTFEAAARIEELEELNESLSANITLRRAEKAEARIKELEEAAKAPLPDEVAGRAGYLRTLAGQLRAAGKPLTAEECDKAAAALERQSRRIVELEEATRTLTPQR